MKDLPLSSSQQVSVQNILAHTNLQAGRFAEAKTVFQALADRMVAQEGAQYTAIVAILTEYADGMYVVTKVYPPQAALIAVKDPPLAVGPASLSKPEAST